MCGGGGGDRKRQKYSCVPALAGIGSLVVVVGRGGEGEWEGGTDGGAMDIQIQKPHG